MTNASAWKDFREGRFADPGLHHRNLQNELAGVFDSNCQQTVAQPARCAIQMANKEENDFWTSVNWDDLLK